MTATSSQEGQSGNSNEEERALLPGRDRRHPTPLPKVQVAAVCLARLGEPIA